MLKINIKADDFIKLLFYKQHLSLPRFGRFNLCCSCNVRALLKTFLLYKILHSWWCKI